MGDAVGPSDAPAVARARNAATALRRVDLATRFLPAPALTVEPLLHGRRYFARMLEDIEAAEHQVHILIYGFKPGAIGTRFRDALVRKAGQGVEVRLEVDALGSEIPFGSKALFADLHASGIAVVANHALPLRRFTRRSVGGRGASRADLLHFDHRKMGVIDGRVAWVGGSGIEDHFADERFYDVMCRITGPVVAQLQLVFLASWRYHGGARLSEDALERAFPSTVAADARDDPEAIRGTVLWNVPGTGHVPIAEAIQRSISSASSRIDIVNPYITNHAVIDGLYQAARRGVRVRVVAPGRPTPKLPAAAFRHHYRRLVDAGVEILLHPEMAHAKVLRMDDQVLIGGCNLDDLSLFRNDELDVMFEGRAFADLVDAQVFEELVGMSTPAVPPTRLRYRAWNASVDRVSRLL
jgi:cardiolipin synthase